MGVTASVLSRVRRLWDGCGCFLSSAYEDTSCTFVAMATVKPVYAQQQLQPNHSCYQCSPLDETAPGDLEETCTLCGYTCRARNLV